MEDKPTDAIDALNQACFLLLGTLQNQDDSHEWRLEFQASMQHMASIMNHFYSQQN